MTGPLPQPTDRLSRVRVLPTAAGGWRVRFRLNGRRRSSCAFSSRPPADAFVAKLRSQFEEAK